MSFKNCAATRHGKACPPGTVGALQPAARTAIDRSTSGLAGFAGKSDRRSTALQTSAPGNFPDMRFRHDMSFRYSWSQPQAKLYSYLPYCIRVASTTSVWPGCHDFLGQSASQTHAGKGAYPSVRQTSRFELPLDGRTSAVDVGDLHATIHWKTSPCLLWTATTRHSWPLLVSVGEYQARWLSKEALLSCEEETPHVTIVLIVH